ncbi:TetR/AcrR family transcriptional regulator [Pseudophaeobacter flagellatus]|uniref:TetR/AcrR family transcriptional regulator n=1 Tax=Pseudophaeobacter flagellatus TaxID=2899119 RepID=UPI001E4DE000|nr:TetR/AcrR family transcriptional regulator [Pseudophaeobacter flagellatus]MCD9147979.1 TetR/AcrR family transcriptional regulator [Pseudophaeobacter flagellatus]
MPTLAPTRTRLLQVASIRLAERGYHGTSLAAVAEDVGVSKQALLHYFGSKALLYRAVLDQLGQDLLQMLFSAMQDGQSAEQQLDSFFAELTARAVQDPWLPSLLLRVLIEDREAESGDAALPLPLQDFLEPLIAVIQATERLKGASFAQALATALHLLGGACLFPAAQAGLAQRFGPVVVEQLRDISLTQIQALRATRQ